MLYKKVGILGFGELGKAMAKFYISPQIEDSKFRLRFSELDILHVCIPFFSCFVDVVKNTIKRTGAKLIIVHSTVPIGTTKKIGGAVVHSPVRGLHPNLYKGIKTFVKYVGYNDVDVGFSAIKHLNKVGIKAYGVNNSDNTEALKLWDTTQYGLMIVLNKEIKKFCDRHGLDFDVVYTSANKTYNKGYIELGRPEVVRPVLKFMPGEIGGHCILPNCGLLPDPIAKLILSKKY